MRCGRLCKGLAQVENVAGLCSGLQKKGVSGINLEVIMPINEPIPAAGCLIVTQ